MYLTMTVFQVNIQKSSKLEKIIKKGKTSSAIYIASVFLAMNHLAPPPPPPKCVFNLLLVSPDKKNMTSRQKSVFEYELLTTSTYYYILRMSRSTGASKETSGKN